MTTLSTPPLTFLVPAPTSTGRFPAHEPGGFPTHAVGWAHDSRQAWQPHLESLRSWWHAPDELGDEYADAPSRETIALAIRFAELMIRDCMPAPTRIVLTVDGGIAFERKVGNALETVEISPDGEAEYMCFQESRLVERFPVDLREGNKAPEVRAIFLPG